jgi:uncharacterized protein
VARIPLFVALTFAFSSPFYVYVFLHPEKWTSTHSHLLMWMPALAALAASLLTRRPLRELGFRLGRPRHYLVAYDLPLLFCGVVYAFVWMTGLGAFDTTRLLPFETRVGLPHSALTAAIVGVGLLLLSPLSMINTLGEELGWSGLLTPELAARTTFAKASLIRGAIWSLWHYPLVIALHPRYRPDVPLVYMLACMTVAVTSISFVYTWLRLDSGSVWPVALLHAVSSNLQDFFEALTRDTGVTHYITYEFGAGFAIVLAIVAFVVWRRVTAASPGASP